MNLLARRYVGRHVRGAAPRRRAGLLATLLLGMAGIIGIAGVARAAGSVGNLTLSGSTYKANTTATWTTTFTTTGGGALANGSTISVTFATGFVVPSSFTPTVSWGDTTPNTPCPGSTGAGSQAVATITLAGCGANGIPKTSALSVIIPGITNASPGSYAASQFTVKTSNDTNAVNPPSGFVLYGPASKLAFGAALSSATAGVAFPTQPSVLVQDSGGRTVGDSSASITLAVTGGGATLSCSGGLTATAASGSAQFSGCSMTVAGTYTLTASATGLAGAASNAFTVNAAAAKQLAFVQAPSSAFAGVAITPAVTVRLQDQFGNSVATSGVNVSLSSSSGSLTATSPVATNTSGIATFSDVTYAGTVLGTALTATSSGLTSTTSSSFDVTVNVTSAANSLAISASDAGSGVKSVSYYYCSGLSGACTSGTLIGTSTSGGSFPINWASRPATGPYRVVAVATDKVGNTSAVSGSTPVTVSS